MTDPTNFSSHRIGKNKIRFNFSIPPKKFLLILVTVLTILGACKIILYFLFFTPEKILLLMEKKMTDVKSLDFSGKLNMTVNGNYAKTLSLLPDKYSLDSEIKGRLNINDKREISTDSDIFLNIQNNFVFNFETRIIKNDIYLNVKSIPDFGFINSESFLNKWIKINSNELALNLKLPDKLASGSAFEFLSGRIPEADIFYLKKTDIRDSGSAGTFYHYSFLINKENLFLLVSQVLENKLGKFDEGDKKTVEKLKQNLDFEVGEMWIDKRTNYLKKITLGVTLNNPGVPDQKVEIHLDANFDNFNKTAIIIAPQNWQPIDSALQVYQDYFRELELTGPK